MSQVQAIEPQKPPLPPGEFMGHPRALWQLFNIELWERFAYYGMRAVLAVYVSTTFFSHLGDQANAEASLVYGGYTALVYATGIAGGYIADRVLGYQRIHFAGRHHHGGRAVRAAHRGPYLVPGGPGADRIGQRPVQAEHLHHDRQAVCAR